MHIKNEQPQRRYNHDFLSHKCQLDGSLNTEFQLKFSTKGKDHPIKTVKKYQCHKFRRVCMVMGVLVLIEESENGGVSFQDLIPKDYIQRNGRQKKTLLTGSVKDSGFLVNKKFNIATQHFKKEPKVNQG